LELSMSCTYLPLSTGNLKPRTVSSRPIVVSPTARTVDDVFDTIDRNHDGVITRDEFDKAWNVPLSYSPQWLPPGSCGELSPACLAMQKRLDGVPEARVIGRTLDLNPPHSDLRIDGVSEATVKEMLASRDVAHNLHLEQWELFINSKLTEVIEVANSIADSCETRFLYLENVDKQHELVIRGHDREILALRNARSGEPAAVQLPIVDTLQTATADGPWREEIEALRQEQASIMRRIDEEFRQMDLRSDAMQNEVGRLFATAQDASKWEMMSNHIQQVRTALQENETSFQKQLQDFSVHSAGDRIAVQTFGADLNILDHKVDSLSDACSEVQKTLSRVSRDMPELGFRIEVLARATEGTQIAEFKARLEKELAAVKLDSRNVQERVTELSQRVAHESLRIQQLVEERAPAVPSPDDSLAVADMQHQFGREVETLRGAIEQVRSAIAAERVEDLNHLHEACQEIWDINAVVKTLHADVTAKLTEFVDLRIQVERAQDHNALPEFKARVEKELAVIRQGLPAKLEGRLQDLERRVRQIESEDLNVLDQSMHSLGQSLWQHLEKHLEDATARAGEDRYARECMEGDIKELRVRVGAVEQECVSASARSNEDTEFRRQVVRAFSQVQKRLEALEAGTQCEVVDISGVWDVNAETLEGARSLEVSPTQGAEVPDPPINEVGCRKSKRVLPEELLSGSWADGRIKSEMRTTTLHPNFDDGDDGFLGIPNLFSWGSG